MIFHKFLELHSKSFEKKKMFVTNFPFLTDSLKPPFPLPHPQSFNSQNLLSVTKAFCQCSLNYHGFLRLLCYDDTRKN